MRLLGPSHKSLSLQPGKTRKNQQPVYSFRYFSLVDLLSHSSLALARGISGPSIAPRYQPHLGLTVGNLNFTSAQDIIYSPTQLDAIQITTV
jgi:hypothetical protein